MKASNRPRSTFLVVAGDKHAASRDNPGRPVFLIVDGHSSHKSKTTRQWVASTGGRIKLFHLPRYSPQLNPVAWAWQNVKNARRGRAGVSSVDDLQDKVLAALIGLATTPSIVRGFFRDPQLAYIACHESD